MSARWGGAFTPLLVVYMFRLVSWRTAFVIFGLLGLVWALAFYLWYRDDPREHPAVNKGELDIIGDAVNSASGHGNVPWMVYELIQAADFPADRKPRVMVG